MHVDAVFGAIGRWAVRLRWLVLLVWVFGAIAAVTQLPSLSSVTQSNNSKFLPASAPSQHGDHQRAADRGGHQRRDVPAVPVALRERYQAGA